LLGFYLYVRALEFGRYIAAMVRDVKLGKYLNENLPKLLLVTRLNYRPIDNPLEWIWEKKIALILLAAFFAGVLILLIYS
jgi:hypothetical protein